MTIEISTVLLLPILLFSIVFLTYNFQTVAAQQPGTMPPPPPRFPPPTSQFPSQLPPPFPPSPDYFTNFLQLQVIERVGPTVSLEGVGTSTAVCHSDEQVVGGGFVERQIAQSSDDFRATVSHMETDKNGWFVMAFETHGSFAAFAECAKIVSAID
jgi:hypothetical protein